MIYIRKIKLLFLFLLFSFNYINAEIINDIDISGNDRISPETIKIYGDIKTGKNYSESDLNNILNKLYQTEFFEDIKIEVENNILKVLVKEYPLVEQLVIIGEKSNKYKEQIKKIIKLKEKRSFINSYLIEDVEIIKSLYSSAGYNSTEVDIKTKKLSNNNLDILIDIKRGEKTKIKSISFIGNSKISNRRLRDVVASSEHKFWKILSNSTNFTENLIGLDVRLLRNYYKSLGFYNVNINSKLAKINENNEVDLTYIIDEGTRFTINKISTNVDSVFDKQLFFPLNKIFTSYIGEYYSPFKIKKLLDDLDDLIEKNNLQFVEHNVEEIIEGNNISVILNVFEGEKKLVERINIIGNSITNENVIRSELILDEGDPLSNVNLQKSIANIKSRNIFKKVEYKISEGSENNLNVIDITVEEQPTGEITAGAGIGTDGGLFALGVKENNWLGSGKSVAFDVEVDQESLTGIFNYVDPNYNFFGNSLNYSFSNEQNDKPSQGYENSLISIGVGTSFEQYKNTFVNLGLTASHDDLRTDSKASTALKNQSGTYSDITGNYGFTFDTRDRSFMPSSGSIFSFGQSLPFYADSSSVSNTLALSTYKTLNENVVGAGKFQLSAVNGIGSDDVRLSKRKVLSTKRLRGFEKGKVGPVDKNDHIGGNYAAAVNFEANLPNLLPEATNFDISTFLDFGNVWGVDYDSTLDDSNKIRSSTGIIANWMSPIGPMNFVISENLSKAKTDKTQSFSFNLGTTF